MKFRFLISGSKGKTWLQIVELLFIPVFFLIFFFYLPITEIIKFAFFSAKGFSFSNLFHVFTDPYTIRVLGFTFREAFVSALVTLIIAFPGAYIISHFKFKWKNFLVSLATVPFILPSILVALGFILLFGKNGMINLFLTKFLHIHRTVNLLYSFWGIILVHAFYNFPIPLRIIGAAWEGLPKKYTYVALSLGSGKLETFFKVTLPLLMPAVISSFTLVFMFCFLSFVIILTIGGARFATIEVSIYMYYNMFFDYRTGSALAFLQALFTLGFVFLYMKTGRFAKKGIEKREIETYENLSGSPKKLFFTVLYLLFITPVIFLPLIIIFATAFTNPVTSGFTLSNFINLFSGKFRYITSISVVRIIFNSFLFALFAMLFSTVFALLISYSISKINKLKDFLISVFMLPIAISPVTIAFAYILAFHNVRFIIDSWIIIAVAHTVIAFPFALRTLYSYVEKMPKSMIFAAQSLGMNRLKTFFAVDMPFLKSSLIVSSVFTFAISLGEFGATFMLYKNRYITMPVALYRFISGRHFGIASAMGSILSLFGLFMFFIIEKCKREASVI